MSWFSSASEWKQGLSSSVITKIDDLEIQNEKLKKEKSQKQNQIDTLQQTLDKQKRKTEDEGKRNQSLQKEVECLGRACETLQEKLTKHGLDSNIPLVGNNSQINSAAASSEKLLMKKIEELENEKKGLEQRLEDLSCNNSNNNNKVYASESQRDNWTPIGGQVVESFPQKSPFKVTVKKALETSEDNPFKAPSSTPVKKGLEISEESPFKTPVKCVPSGFLVQPLSVKSDESEKLEKKLAVALKQIDELQKQNHVLISKNKPDSTVENDYKKERTILKTEEDESVKSVSSSLESQLQQTKEQLSFYQTQSQNYEKKAEDLEGKVKILQTELDCQRQNLETSKIRLEDKLKEKQKEHIEDTGHFQAELSTLEQEIRDLKTKFQQQETLFLCNENAMQGCLDKIKSQLVVAEKEKVLAQSQCGQFETSLAKLEKTNEELTKLCTHLKQERDMVKAQVENLKIKLNDSEAVQNRLQSQIESSEGSVVTLKSSIEEALADHKAALNKERETHKLEIECITKEKDKNLKAKDDSILTLKEEMKNVMESLEEALKNKDEAEKKSTTVEEDCKTKLSGVNSLEERIGDLEKSLTEKEKIISEGKSLLEDKISAAEKEASQKICAVEERLQEQALNLVSKNAEIEARNEKLQKATDTISSLVSTLNVAKEKLATYESMKTVHEEKLQEFNNCIKSEESKVSLLEKNLTETEALLSSSQQSLQIKNNEVENLKNKVSSLTVDVTLYINENKCKDTQIWELNNFIKSVNKDKAELDATVEKLKSENETESDRHRKEVEGYMSTISDMENNLQEGVKNLFDNQKCIENLQEYNDILCQTISVSNNEISEMNSSNEALNQKVDSLLKEKKAIEDDNAKIKEELFKAEREQDLIKIKLSETDKRYFEEIAISLKLGNDLKEKVKLINKLSKDLEMKNEEVKELVGKMNHLEESKVELQTCVTRYEEQINNLKIKVSDIGESKIAVASTTEDQNAKRDQRDKEMEELTLELICKNDQLETKVQILQNENSSLIQLRESNENKLQSYKSENIFLEKETKELKFENLNFLSKIRELNMILKELEEEKETEINANKKLVVENSDLISQRDYLEEKRKILEAGKELQELFKDEHCLVILESLKASYYDLHSKNNDDGFELWLKESLCKTEEKFEEIKESKSHVAELIKEIELLKAKLEDMQKDVDLKTVELENLKDEVYPMKDKIGKIEKERNDLLMAQNEYHTLKTSLENEGEILKSKLEDMQRNVDLKTVELENLRDDFYPMKDKISKIEKEKNDLLMAQNEYHTLKTSLENECEILKSKLVEFDVKLLNSESEKKNLLEQNATLMNLNESYEEKYSRLQNKINSLMSEIATLKEISEEKTNEIERLEGEKETLIREKVDCKRLEKTIENLKTLESTYIERNDDLQNRIEKLIESELILKENLEKTEKMRLTLVNQISSLNNDVYNLKLENEVLKKEKEFIIDENVSLNVLKTELLNKAEKFENEIKKENEKNVTLREQCKDFENTKRLLEDLTIKNKSFENLLEEKERKMLEMEEKMNNLEVDFRTLQQKYDSVVDEVTGSKNSIEVLLMEKENLLLEKNSLCQEVAESQNVLQDELEKEKIISCNLLSKCNEFEVNINEKENDLRDAREVLEQVKEELEQQSRNHDIQVTQLHEKVEEFSKGKIEMETILLEKDKKVREYEKNIAEYKKNLDFLKAKFELSHKNTQRKEKEFEKLHEHKRNIKNKLKGSEDALEKCTSELTRSELKLRDLQELLDAKILKCEQLDALYHEVSVEKINMLQTINNLRDKASELEVQKRNLEKDLSKKGSCRKPFFSRESTSQSDSSSSSSVIGLSQTPLMGGISKVVTRKSGPISGMVGKRKGRRSGRRSTAREFKNASIEQRKEAAYDKFQSIVCSAEQEALKKEGLSKRLTRSSLSLSQDSVKRYHSATNSSAEENRPKKLKLGLNPEGLSTKVCQGLNDIFISEDSPGVLTRQTTPLKIKEKAENKDNRRPLKSLDVNNDTGRVPSSPKEENHNEEVTDDAHLEVSIQRDLLCSRRSSLYPREGNRKGSKDCNAQ